MTMNIRLRTEQYQLGRINDLEVLRLVSIGAYLDWSSEDGVLLPLRYLPQGTKEGDRLSVFVYHDNEGRLIATTLRPLALVGEVAYLSCVEVMGAGAFLRWGIHKDLLVPFAEQNVRMQQGQSYLVYLYIDKVSGKIVASAKLNKHIGNLLPQEHKVGDKVRAVLYEPNDYGYRVVVEHKYWGIIYFDQSVSESWHRGQELTCYISRIREDGRLDLSVRPIGYDRVLGDMTQLLRLLRQSGGRIPIGDKSSSDDIMRLTGLSKKSFKAACGALYKKRRVMLYPEEIVLIID